MYARQWPIQNILLIDDDEDDFFFFSEAVKSVNAAIHVSHISDGNTDPAQLDALEPDLIFLDINMPKRNGIECLRQIKQSRHKDTPVVIYSTTRNQLFIKQAYETGAHLFLTKPFSFDKLVASLRSIIQLNWTEPAKITSTYYSDGRYQAFGT